MIKKLKRVLDGRDLLFTAGLGLLGYGLWQIHEPAAFIGLGAVLLFVTVRR